MRRSCCVIAVMLAATTPLAGQRTGVWVGFGLGPASGSGNCDICTNNEWTTGPSGYLRIGGMATPQLLLGIEGGGWRGSRESNGIDEVMVAGSVIMLWYPSQTGALFLKLGVGALRYSASNDVDELKTGTRPTASVGLGYEFKLSPRFSILPFGSFLYASSGTVTLNGQSHPAGLEIQASLLQLGAGLAFH